MKIQIRELRYYHFLALFMISLLMSVFLLRQNNLTMIKLRDEVVAIDDVSGGDIKAIEPALKNLSEFVGAHMNTTMTSPVVLVSRYNVLFTELVNDQQASASVYRQNVYAKAQQLCEVSSVPLTVRAQCIQDYVGKQPGVDQIDPPPVELFSYEFVSPTWSPDLAGISVLITFLLAIAAVGTWLLDDGLSMLVNMVRNDPLE